MKTLIKNSMALILLLGIHAESQAQNTVSNVTTLNLVKIPSYQIEVTYNKTSHLIFPAPIRYVDLGSEFLIADKAKEVENVLRLKATVRDFAKETNFSVITEDGRFYNFNASYNSFPDKMNYNLLQLKKNTIGADVNEVFFEELGSNSPSIANSLLEAIYKENKRIIKHIDSKSFGIRFLLKGIYIHNDKLYFHTELINCSNAPFQIDFVQFKVVDKKRAKRTLIQERVMTPLRTYKPLNKIVGNAKEQNVFLLDQFTISDDKLLLIEIYENNGERYQVLKVECCDLVRAKLIKNLELKIN